MRFEGDRERYWIPAESILEIKHEFWAESVQHQLQKAPSLNHVIVVRAMTASGPWETWFYSRQYKFRPHTEKRRLANALELESKNTRTDVASKEGPHAWGAGFENLASRDDRRRVRHGRPIVAGHQERSDAR